MQRLSNQSVQSSRPGQSGDLRRLSAPESPLLELVGITRQYPGIKALNRVDFAVRSGEVHVLFGENGAGKSTLISIVAGAVKPHAGQLRFKGEPVQLTSVHHARALGISAVFQEFSLVPELSVEQNLFLGSEPTQLGVIKKTQMRKRATEILERLGFVLRPEASVAFLTRAEQQMVEIAKAFRDELSVLILDEPTASLTDKETDELFSLIEQVKSQGVGIIYITHRINEIRTIGDRITVLRDGHLVDTVSAKTSESELVRLMTGRVIDQIFPDIGFHPGEKFLEVNDLSTVDGSVVDVSLNVRCGEVIGIAGLVGSGKSEIARACFGLVPKATGQVSLTGEDISQMSPGQIMDRGFFYVPADRREEGLMMMRSVRENIALPALNKGNYSKGGILKRKAEISQVRELASRLNLQPPKIEWDAGQFSGGNQQKILLAKCLTREIRLFVFDEPTVGVDIGTRVAIYEFIRDLCESGAAVVLISSDLPEILHLTHRVYVMCRGVLTAELYGSEISQESVLKHCFERQAA